MFASSARVVLFFYLAITFVCLAFQFPDDTNPETPVGEDENIVTDCVEEEPVPATPIRFHSRAARNMRVADDGQTVYRRNNRAFGNTAALTDRPLQRGEVFEVWVYSWDKIEHPRIGVTTLTPENIQYPDYMNHLREGTWGWDVWPDQIYVHGEITKEPYTEGERDIRRGDRFGVSVSDEGQLRFHYNGRELGIAAEDMSGDFYAYVDLYWQGSNATIVS